VVYCAGASCADASHDPPLPVAFAAPDTSAATRERSRRDGLLGLGEASPFLD